MIARALFILLFALAAVLPAAAQDAAHEKKIREHAFYKALDEEAQKSAGRPLLDYIDDHLQRDASLLPVASLWLREHSIGEDSPAKINALYFLTYADTLVSLAEGYRLKGEPGHYRALMQTALLNLHIFEVMGSVDAARCQDPTALAAVRKMASSRLDVFENGYRMFPRDIIDGIQKAALRDEDKNLLRFPNTDICNMGQARMYDLVRTPGAKEKIVSDPRFKGGKRKIFIPPAGYVYSPPLVPDSDWIAARKKTLEAVSGEWARRYAQAVR